MGKLEEFKKRRRRWYIEVFFEFASMVMFFVTYLTHGDTNTLIFWAVMYFWSKADAQKAYKAIMELRP